MRLRAGAGFVSYIRQILDPHPLAVQPARRGFGSYNFRAFENVADMRDKIFQRDKEVGFLRIVAGYAWE